MVITHTLLSTHVHTTPGVSSDTFDSSNLYAYITLSPRESCDGNPACAYVVKKIGLLTFDDVNVKLRQDLELNLLTLKALRESRAAQWGHELVKWCTLMVLHVPDLGISIRYDTHLKETHAIRSMEDGWLEAEKIKACIADGIVMKDPKREGNGSLFGRMVKANEKEKEKEKKWKWEAIPETDAVGTIVASLKATRDSLEGATYTG